MNAKNPYALHASQYSTHNIIIENIGKDNVVLDVGCNDGYIGKISDSTNKFYGLEYSRESVAEAKKIYVDALQYDLNDLKILPWDMKFDVIIFADVLEHVLHPDAVLDYFVKNYLKEGGKVILSLPNVANWQVRLNLLFGKFDYIETGIMDKTHLHFYTFESAHALASKNNLKIQKTFEGASFFGPILKVIPSFGKMLATDVILICEK